MNEVNKVNGGLEGAKFTGTRMTYSEQVMGDFTTVKQDGNKLNDL
jgi:hypothetical protein